MTQLNYRNEAADTHVPVSVVIPCFHCEDTVATAVHSVWEQDQRPRELIIVDDASGEITQMALRSIQQQYTQGWIKLMELEKNGGPSIARNLGWDNASEQYVAFLDADDFWHPRKIAIQYSMMTQYPSVVLSGHQAFFEESAPTHIQTLSALPALRVLDTKEMLAGNPFVTPSVMLRRNLPVRFNPRMRYCEDYALWLEIGLRFGQVALIMAPLAYVRRSGAHGGLSDDEYRMRVGFARVYRELWRSGYLSFAYAARRSGELYAKAAVFRLLGPSLHRRVKRISRKQT